MIPLQYPRLEAYISPRGGGGGGGVLMVSFSIALLEWGCTISDWVRQFSIFTVSKLTRMFVLYVKSKVGIA